MSDHLTFHEQQKLINTSYLVSKDENDESQDEDEDSHVDDDDDEDEDKENCMETKTPARHSHQTGARVNGGYDRTSARTKPQKLSKASEIIISGIQKKDSKEVIKKQLLDTYHEGGDLPEIFCSSDSLGVTALTIAVLSDNCCVAECLLQIVFSVHRDLATIHRYINRRDKEGNTMLHEMSYMGHKIINTLRRLLSLRICNVSNNIEHSQLQNPIFDIHTSNNAGQYPLHFSMKSPRFCTEAVQVFYDVDPNILKVTDLASNTILHYFLLCLPQHCSTFHSSQEAATAVKKTLEFLLRFESGRDCLLLCNKNNKTPELLLSEINNISPQARAAATQVLRKQPKPVLLQIPLDQPSTIYSSSLTAMQNEPSPIPATQIEPSAIPAMQRQASPISLNQLSPIPSHPLPIYVMENQPSTNTDIFQGAVVPEISQDILNKVGLGYDEAPHLFSLGNVEDISTQLPSIDGKSLTSGIFDLNLKDD